MTIENELLENYEQLELDLGIPEIQPIVNAESLEMKEQLIADVMRLGVKAHRVTKNCVFVEFLAHVNKLIISVRESAEVFQRELLRISIYTDTYTTHLSKREIQDFESSTIRKLKQTKEVLEAIIEKGGIDAVEPVQELLLAN